MTQISFSVSNVSVKARLFFYIHRTSSTTGIQLVIKMDGEYVNKEVENNFLVIWIFSSFQHTQKYINI